MKTYYSQTHDRLGGTYFLEVLRFVFQKTFNFKFRPQKKISKTIWEFHTLENFGWGGNL